MQVSDYPRTWRFEHDGELDGRFREIREVTTADGPRALVELELVDGSEVVTLWLAAEALRRRFADELRLRVRSGASDFDPGERIRIRRGDAKRTSASGRDYWPFEVTFENAARRTAADVLLGDDDGHDDDREGAPDDAIPF
jgi:hypothetical protein